MKLEPIGRREVVGAARDAILSMIVDEGLMPGDELPPQAELIGQLGISRTSLREAIQRLVALRVVTVRPGKRMVVGDMVRGRQSADLLTLESSLRRQALVELVETRSMLEPEVAALAAERATNSQLDRLEAILEEMRRVKGAEAALQLNFAFHRRLAEASGNEIACRLLRSLEDSSIELYQDLYHKLYDQDPYRDEAAQHYEIYMAAKHRNPDKIRGLMRQHVEEWLMKEVIEVYGQNGM